MTLCRSPTTADLMEPGRSSIPGVDACERARQVRDPAYDGVFFVAATSTGIYCRPICRVRPPLAKNVIYYPSAAACEAAGFRPCLRCRPETAPHSPAWNGVKTSVDRALRLIEEGALDQSSVAHLADRLGIGPRHLSRLFRDQLGSTPVQAARTARVQRAKRLLDETALSMTDIAAQSGFASLRSFNAVFVDTYRCPPTAIRRGCKDKACSGRAVAGDADRQP